MSEPTEDRLKRIEQEQERLKQEQEALKKQLEQATEPMKAINVNVASADVIARLDKLEQNQTAHFEVMVKTVQDSANELKDTLATKEDLKTLKEDIRDMLIQYLRPGGNGH